MALAADTTPEEAARVDQLKAWLRAQVVGEGPPRSVDISREEDSDDRPAWFVVLTLANPPQGEDTWPIDAVLELQRNMRDKALELGVSWPWHLVLRPEEDDTPAEEDAGPPSDE